MIHKTTQNCPELYKDNYTLLKEEQNSLFLEKTKGIDSFFINHQSPSLDYYTPLFQFISIYPDLSFSKQTALRVIKLSLSFFHNYGHEKESNLDDYIVKTIQVFKKWHVTTLILSENLHPNCRHCTTLLTSSERHPSSKKSDLAYRFLKEQEISPLSISTCRFIALLGPHNSRLLHPFNLSKGGYNFVACLVKDYGEGGFGKLAVTESRFNTLVDHLLEKKQLKNCDPCTIQNLLFLTSNLTLKNENYLNYLNLKKDLSQAINDHFIIGGEQNLNILIQKIRYRKQQVSLLKNDFFTENPSKKLHSKEEDALNFWIYNNSIYEFYRNTTYQPSKESILFQNKIISKTLPSCILAVLNTQVFLKYPIGRSIFEDLKKELYLWMISYPLFYNGEISQDLQREYSLSWKNCTTYLPSQMVQELQSQALTIVLQADLNPSRIPSFLFSEEKTLNLFNITRTPPKNKQRQVFLQNVVAQTIQKAPKVELCILSPKDYLESKEIQEQLKNAKQLKGLCFSIKTVTNKRQEDLVLQLHQVLPKHIIFFVHQKWPKELEEKLDGRKLGNTAGWLQITNKK